MVYRLKPALEKGLEVCQKVDQTGAAHVLKSVYVVGYVGVRQR